MGQHVELWCVCGSALSSYNALPADVDAWLHAHARHMAAAVEGARTFSRVLLAVAIFTWLTRLLRP